MIGSKRQLKKFKQKLIKQLLEYEEDTTYSTELGEFTKLTTLKDIIQIIDDLS
jgi:hypothetical protein